jgi:hypothetical protein
VRPSAVCDSVLDWRVGPRLFTAFDPPNFPGGGEERQPSPGPSRFDLFPSRSASAPTSKAWKARDLVRSRHLQEVLHLGPGIGLRWSATLAAARAPRPATPPPPAEERDERAPVHWTSSSARISNASGTSRPSALAVLRLMTSSTFTDCCTGRSEGFAPLRIVPA